MRKVIFTIVAILTICTSLSLILVSCIPTAGEVQVLTDTNRQLQSSFVELKNAVKESEVVDQDRADKILGEVENVLGDMGDVAAAIEGREGMDVVKEGVKASAGWNPYAQPILLGITVIEALGLFGLGKKNKDQGQALQEIVVGIEDSKKYGPKLGPALNASESIKTRKIVSGIKNKLVT